MSWRARTCSNPDCNVIFEPRRHHPGRAAFCSDRCRRRARTTREAQEREREALTERLAPAERPAEEQQAPTGCSCGAALVADEDGWPVCFTCGRPAPGPRPTPNGFDAAAAELISRVGPEGELIPISDCFYAPPPEPVGLVTRSVSCPSRPPRRRCLECGAALRRGNHGPACESCTAEQLEAVAI